MQQLRSGSVPQLGWIHEGSDCELLVARKYTPAVELNWALLHDKEGTARPCQAQPLQARPLGRLPWEAEIVPTYLALKPVQQDVMNFTPMAPVHITVLLLLAWSVWRSGVHARGAVRPAGHVAALV